MAKYFPILSLGLLLAATACERPAPPTFTEEGAPYDLTAYLQQQKQRLVAEQPMVLKSVTTENQPTETVQTDKVDWEDELAVFEQTDLNRPALQEYYVKQETVLENGSVAIEYRKTENSEPLVQYLRLVISPDKQLQQLNAVLQDENPLFFSRRKVRLDADPVTGNISSYNVQGVQKLIFSDSLHYAVDANL
ncbi:hypothetical protein ACFSRY_09320 [Pontibacter locisalis]|uniref:Uncharacterized protein n=1 Tax=Pontibacter locisalis TaxID=1719035 RepID=A0ABW5IK90_9BACT